jgi:hypothetical protein
LPSQTIWFTLERFTAAQAKCQSEKCTLSELVGWALDRYFSKPARVSPKGEEAERVVLRVREGVSEKT